MAHERVNIDDEEEEDTNVEQEEEGRCQACASCDRIHKYISKWILPEDVRDAYLERANCIPPPIFIICISIVELAIFIYYAVWMTQKQFMTLDLGVWESPYIYKPDKREQAWRFLSYMLVHAGIQHILGNLILQLFLGIPLEMVHKGHRVGLVYLLGVIGGSLASSIFDPMNALVGASGGVYALMGGYFMNVLVNFKEMVPLFGIVRLLIIILIVGTDVGFALYRRFISHDVGTPVSYMAHVGGGLAGITIGYVVFSSFDKNLIKDPRFWICIAAYVVCFSFAVFFNIFLSPAPK